MWFEGFSVIYVFFARLLKYASLLVYLFKLYLCWFYLVLLVLIIYRYYNLIILPLFTLLTQLRALIPRGV